MSRSRSRRHGWQRPTNSYSYPAPAPDPDSPGYQRILLRGCGGVRDSYTGEFDCSHLYPWSCEDCPIVGEATKDTPDSPETVQLT